MTLCCILPYVKVIGDSGSSIFSAIYKKQAHT